MADEHATIIIERRRSGILEIFLYSAACTYLIFTVINNLKKPGNVTQVVFISIALFALGMMIYRRYFTVSFFKIDDEGIHDLRKFIGVGLIKWESINKLESFSTLFLNAQYLKVFVENSESVIQQTKGCKRYILRRRMRNYKTPVLLSAYNSAHTFNKLSALILERLRLKQYTVKQG